jgi:hypothetical protein
MLVEHESDFTKYKAIGLGILAADEEWREKMEKKLPGIVWIALASFHILKTNEPGW